MRVLQFLALFSCLWLITAPPASAVGAGKTCGGFIGTPCDEGLWCEHPAGQCGVADGTGTCVRETGPICTEQYLPVCACGGVQYSNDCRRKAAKAQLDHVGTCGE
jgi:hypothetical protein